jgi:hypothetical protein
MYLEKPITRIGLLPGLLEGKRLDASFSQLERLQTDIATRSLPSAGQDFD